MTAMNILYIDSSILGGGSVSRGLTAKIVDRLLHLYPGSVATYRDLATEPLPHLTGAVFAARMTDAEPPAAIAAELSTGRRVLKEYVDADVIVVGAGLYNFGIPSQLKAWVDSVCVAGKTFQYTPEGPKPMAGGKRVFLAIARGGIYAPGSPYEAFEHGETYLKQVFGFLGNTNIEAIVAEGLSMGPEAKEAAVAKAHAAIEAISK